MLSFGQIFLNGQRQHLSLTSKFELIKKLHEAAESNNSVELKFLNNELSDLETVELGNEEEYVDEI